MTTKKRETSKKGTKKLKLKKETIKDLSARRKAGDVKGGVADWETRAPCRP